MNGVHFLGLVFLGGLAGRFESIRHRRGLKEFAAILQTGIVMIAQIIHQAGPKYSYGFGISGILSEVLHLIRIPVHVVKFLAGTLAIGMFEKGFHLGVLTVRNDPSLGWAGILVGQSHEGLIFQQGKIWFFGSIKKIRVSKRPTVRL